MESNKYIPLNKLREGAELCLKNAQRLYDDSVLLATSNRYASGLSLLILSSEEASKGLLIMERLDKKESITEKKWKEWTGGSAHMLRLEHLNEKLKETYGFDFFKPFNKKEINRLKQFGFYIDWKENRDWSAFFEKLDDETVISLHESFLKIAKMGIELLKKDIRKLEGSVERTEKDEEKEKIMRKLRELGYF